MLILGIITGLIILVLLVVVHELGHGIVARRNGVVVEEFGIGFPPKAWGKKVKDSILGKNVLFTLNWLPLGGFVKLKGEHDAAEEEGDYGAASYWQKTKILLAGVAMNWIVAIVLLTVLALAGMPKILDDQFSIPSDTTTINKPIQITQVEPGSPADKAGLKTGDEVLRINGIEITSPTDLSNMTKTEKGKLIEVRYNRGGVEDTAKVSLRTNNDDRKGYLGVGTGQRSEMKATWSAPIVGVGTTVQFTAVTLWGTGKLIVDSVKGVIQSLSFDKTARDNGNKELATVSSSVAGPVGILGTIFPQAQAAGLKSLTFLTAVISLSLAVMNFLPIPALDGGRWWTMTWYRLRHKKLTREREEKIQTIGFAIIMGLVLLVTWADVSKLFR